MGGTMTAMSLRHAPSPLPAALVVEEQDACFVATTTWHRSLRRFIQTNSRSIGIIAGVKVVTTKMMVWSAL
jgi:hypothetical protein